MIKGKRVLVVEDGPTLTHGGMATGAGIEAAREFRAAEVIDPRPYAKGVIEATYAAYPHLGPILPAVGYYEEQLRDLEATINAVPADVVVSATPFSLGSLLTINKPLVQITYELAERTEPRLSGLLDSFSGKQGLSGLKPGGRFEAASPWGRCLVQASESRGGREDVFHTARSSL